MMPDPRRSLSILLGGGSAVAVSLTADVQPTGAPIADLFWVGLMGCTVGWAVRFTPATTLIGIAAVGAVLLRSPVDAVAIVLLLLSAVARTRGGRTSRSVPGASTCLGALSLPWVLLRFADAGVPYLSAAVAGLIMTVLLAFAIVRARTSTRRHVGVAAVVAATLTVAFASLSMGDLRTARDAATDAEGQLNLAVSAARRGDFSATALALRTANTGLATAEQRLQSWRVAPLRYVPGAGQNLAVSRDLTGRLSGVVDAANAAADADVEFDDLTGPRGLAPDSLAPLLETADEIAGRATLLAESLEQHESTWLAPSLRAAIDRLEEQLAPLTALGPDTPQIHRAMNGLLGVDQPRRYLVLFGNPAEARELGGFTGGTAVMTVDGGVVSVDRVDRPGALNENPATPHVFSEPQPQRFLEHRPWLFVQNFTAMADFPTLAHALGDLYPAMAGGSVDGVIYLDTQAFSALLAITGPVRVSSLEEPVTSRNVADLLTIEQYAHFDERAASEERDARLREREDREGFLSELMDATFNSLVSSRRQGQAADPQPLVKAIQQDRLLFVPFDEEAARLTSSLGLDGAIADVGSGDYLAVSHLNGGPNKLDAYLDRRIEYDVDLDTDTGDLRAMVTITLTNTAPDDLPGYAGGNSHGYPPSTNRATLVVHTPHELVGWSGGDEPELTRSFREFDRWRHEQVVAVPAGGSRTVTVELAGAIDLADGYSLDIGHQPLITADELRVSVPPYVERSFTLWHDRSLGPFTE